jgi:hypothetical protein
MSQINLHEFIELPREEVPKWHLKAGLRVAFCAILCLGLRLQIFADNPPPLGIAKGKAEHLLGGINIHKDTVASVMMQMGPPEKFQESTSSDLSGERSYEWNRGGIRLRMGTEFYTDRKAMTLVESPPIVVDVWGQSGGDTKVGATGGGLLIGDDLAKVKNLYGDRFEADPHSVTFEWKDETILALDFSNDGHITHMRLHASQE